MSPDAPLGRVGLEAQLLDLFLFVGSQWILYVLLVLSVISLAVTVERIVHFSRRRDDLEVMQRALSSRLAAGRVDEALSLAAAGRSPAAAIVHAGLEALDRGAGAAEEVMASATHL